MRSEELDLLAPLPDRHGAESVDQEEGGLLGVFDFGRPIVDGGFVVDGDGLGGEAGSGEAAAEVAAVEGGEADERGKHGCCGEV